VLALWERIFTLGQFATYTYAQNVVHGFVAPENPHSSEANLFQVTS